MAYLSILCYEDYDYCIILYVYTKHGISSNYAMGKF